MGLSQQKWLSSLLSIVHLRSCTLNRVKVVTAIVSSRVEAHLIVGMLRDHGVKAVMSADDLGGVDMALQMQGVRVLVSNEDEKAARQLLNQSELLASAPKASNAFQKWLFKLLGGNS